MVANHGGTPRCRWLSVVGLPVVGGLSRLCSTLFTGDEVTATKRRQISGRKGNVRVGAERQWWWVSGQQRWEDAVVGWQLSGG